MVRRGRGRADAGTHGPSVPAPQLCLRHRVPSGPGFEVSSPPSARDVSYGTVLVPFQGPWARRDPRTRDEDSLPPPPSRQGAGPAAARVPSPALVAGCCPGTQVAPLEAGAQPRSRTREVSLSVRSSEPDVCSPSSWPISHRRAQGQAGSPSVALALALATGVQVSVSPRRRLRYFSGWKTVAAEAGEVGGRSPRYGIRTPRAQCGALVRLGCGRALMGIAAKCLWWLRAAGTWK